MNEPVSITLAERSEGSGAPLYVQLYTLLIRRLEAGDWPLGHRLPTLEELMDEYGVSRATVREAMARLEREGAIRRSRGRGTHVIKDMTKDRWLILPNTWTELVGHIETLEARIEEISSGFAGLPQFDLRGTALPEYWEAKRVNHLATGAPYSKSKVYVARDIFETDPDGYRGNAALPLLTENPAVTIADAYQSLTVSTADLPAAHYLGLDVGSPVAEVRREALNEKGELIYFAEIVYAARYLRIDTRLI